jgi:basic membrane protein A
MKKIVALLLAVALCLGMVACSSSTTNSTTSTEAGGSDTSTGGNSTSSGEKEKILFFTAFIGDFGLSDMGYRAVQAIAEKYDMEWTLVEYGSYDAALAVNCFWDALETTHYDYFFGPTWYIEDLIDQAAAMYPDTTFIHYDVGKGVEFNEPNVYGITFAQNESAFMAALIQAMMTKTGKIGCLSSDSPIMNDFSTGWIAGCKYAKDVLGLDIEWIHSYMPEVAMSSVYESMNVMYANGCDAVWPITAQMMLAGAQAAEEHGGIENGYFVMGCDYDQYSYFESLASEDASSAVGYENVLTSITKNIEPAAMAIIDSVKGDHSIPSGNMVWGVYEDGVGYLENENFLEWVPEDVQATLKEIINKIGAGEIVVPSYYDFATYDDFAYYRDNADATFNG